MKLKRTKFLRLIGRKYLTTPWAVYAAPMAIIRDNDLSHEAIHQKQWNELTWVVFMLWYSIEFMIKLFKYKKCHSTYRNLSFEREAYANDRDENYLKTRKRYAFLKYI
jgi:hypothetical protein